MLPGSFVRCFLSFVLFSASSFSLSSVELTYINYPDGIGISGCVDSSCPSELVIPEMINSKKVTRIEEGAFCQWFDNNTNPSSIILPNTLKHIGEEAFCYLDSIVIPASVISIYDAFYEIANIYVMRPANQYLNVYDFPVNSNLYACDGNNPDGNPINCEEAYPTIARNPLDLDAAQLLVDMDGNIEIPDSYTWIEEEAFDFTGINSIIIPNSIFYIQEESFWDISGDIYIIKPAEQYINPFHLPVTANLYACDGLNEEGIAVNCEEAYPGIVRNELDYETAVSLVDINGHLEIPNTYTMINDRALLFEGITSISMPNIMHIPEDVLDYNTLDSLIIPSSVVSYPDDSYLDVVGDIYIIKPADQYVNPYHLPNTSNHYVCESVDNTGNPNGCEGLWQSTTSEDQYAILDIDQNGSFDALTDGLILLRYAFGLRGDSLINEAIDTNANRTTAAEIEAHIQSLVP